MQTQRTNQCESKRRDSRRSEMISYLLRCTRQLPRISVRLPARSQDGIVTNMIDESEWAALRAESQPSGFFSAH
eukprot:6237192-Amphidinium_carterae.1